MFCIPGSNEKHEIHQKPCITSLFVASAALKCNWRYEKDHTGSLKTGQISPSSPIHPVTGQTGVIYPQILCFGLMSTSVLLLKLSDLLGGN